MAKAKVISTDVPPPLAVVLGQLAVSDEEREKLSPGEYTVDAKIHLTAKITVGKDQMAKQVNKVEPWVALGIALDHLNDVTRRHIIDQLASILDKPEDSDEERKVKKDRRETIKTSTQEAMESLAMETMQPRKGAVKVVSQHIGMIE